MKRLAFLVTFALVAVGLTQPSAKAATGENYSVCATESSTYCIVSLAIRWAGHPDFIDLPQTGTTRMGSVFTADASYSPTTGTNTFVVNASNEIFGGSEPTEGIARLSIWNWDAVAEQNANVDPTTDIKVVIRLASTLPGAFVGNFRNADIKLSTSGSNYQLTSISKPISGLFTSAVSALPIYRYVGMQPASDRAWFYVETNAQSTQLPTWSGTGLMINISGPHFLDDGVTLNEGWFRIVFTNAMITDAYGLSLDQALNGGLVVQNQEIETNITESGASISRINDGQIELKLNPFHYSSRSVSVRSNSKFKNSNLNWSGSKSSIKRGKSLVVKSKVTSGGKKANGTIRVQLFSSAGLENFSASSSVKKGTGKITLSKGLTRGLSPGIYKLRLTYSGTGNAKNAVRDYRLRVK